MKRVLATLAAALTFLALGGSASGASAPVHSRPLGIIPPASKVGRLARSTGPAFPTDQCPPGQTPVECNLDYHGGAVMHSTTTYAIYWVPAGYHVSANYETLINQYLTDVAAASGTTANVYSTDTQYYDTTSSISYASSFGGSYVDSTSSIPTSHCNDGGNHVCVTDADIQAEIQQVLTIKGWHGGASNMFVVMTPNGVGSCFYSGHASTTNPCTSNAYCAYHQAFTDSNGEPVIYASEPYDATIPGCNSGNSPNGDDADSTINTISHEHNEAITDPFGDAWWNSASGQENGDNCAWVFGPPVTMGGDYNQVINGHHYWLQEEWSNDGSACVQHYAAPPASFSAPAVSGSAAEGQILSTTVGLWTNDPTLYAYQWQRCATDGSGCSVISGTGASTYLLTAADVGHTIRSAINAQNGVGSSGYVQSAPTAVVVPLPVATSNPVVAGVAAVGGTLSTTTGTWNTSASFAYQWLRCAANGSACAAIPAATASSYPVVGADAGHRLEAVVSASNAAGTGSASSATTAVVVAVPTASKAPRISGNADVGKRLRALRGTWAGPPATYRYSWLRCTAQGTRCVPISKAIRSTYTVTKHDAGHRLRLRITAVNAAGQGAAVSPRTTRVAN